jgi:single-strand DNA-binding protein
MASVNKVILLGRLGQDPELRYTQGGQPVCSMSIATSEVWNDKDGNKQESTEWHKVIVWGKMGENCAKYLSKGRQAYIEGKLQTRSWDDKDDGKKRYATEIVAHSVQFIADGQGKPQQQQGQQQQQQERRSQPVASLDDIPF